MIDLRGMRSAFRAAISVALAVAGCTRVVETIPLEIGEFSPRPSCHSSFGAYYLPRALFRIVATAADTNSLDTSKLSTAMQVVADRTQTLCLDYLWLPNSEDKVTVQREPNGLLTAISSSVEDRTPQIVASLVETGELLTVAAARTTGALPGDVVDLEFDPFNWDELMAAKKALRRFGYCLYVEGYSFTIDTRDPPRMLAAGQVWCDDPHPPRPIVATDEFSSLPVSPEVMSTGVLYRPNMSHRIAILRRIDPGGRDPWKLYQTKRVDMPNISPILSVGVKRAHFTTRKTALLFNKGVLTDVAIDKKSELVGFVQIPLALAKAIVSVPGQIFTLRITDTNNQTGLLAAQTELIKAMAEHRANVAAGADARSLRTTTFSERRNVELWGACQNAGGGEYCNTWNPRGDRQ